MLEFELQTILNFIKELSFLLFVFAVFLFLVIRFGRQLLINIIIGLYLALLVVQTAPFLPSDSIFGYLVAFLLITTGATFVIAKLMPVPFREKKFESFGKKLFLTTAATILIMLFSFHVIPVDQVITIGSPISAIFASTELFFWWLITPFVLLYWHK